MLHILRTVLFSRFRIFGSKSVVNMEQCLSEIKDENDVKGVSSNIEESIGKNRLVKNDIKDYYNLSEKEKSLAEATLKIGYGEHHLILARNASDDSQNYRSRNYWFETTDTMDPLEALESCEALRLEILNFIFDEIPYKVASLITLQDIADGKSKMKSKLSEQEWARLIEIIAYFESKEDQLKFLEININELTEIFRARRINTSDI